MTDWSALATWEPPNAEQAALRRSYVDHLAAHPEDGLFKPCFPAHLTAGVLVLSHDHSSVLLNLHRKAGRWFHFGGHIETTDASLVAAATREGLEESGLALTVSESPVHLSRHSVAFCSPRGPVDHLDVRFVATAPPGAEATISDESLDVRWWPVSELPTDEPDMLELVERSLVAR